jgi:hypothetical protein
MPKLRRKRGPRGPRLNYALISELLSVKPLLSYQEIADKAECSRSSVEKYAAFPAAKRKSLAAASPVAAASRDS